jgi:hypothetical protein
MSKAHLLPQVRRPPLQTLLLFQLSQCAGVIGHVARSDESGCNSYGRKRSSSPSAPQKRPFTRSLIPHRSKPVQRVRIGGSPGSNGSSATLVLPPPHLLRLRFMDFLPRSFRRWTFLSGTSLDSPVILFCLFFPRPFLFAHARGRHASLFFSSCLICSLLTRRNLAKERRACGRREAMRRLLATCDLLRVQPTREAFPQRRERS